MALSVATAHKVGDTPWQQLLGVQQRRVVCSNDVAIYLFWRGVAKPLRHRFLAFGAGAATPHTTTAAAAATAASSLLSSFPQLHQVLCLHTDVETLTPVKFCVCTQIDVATCLSIIICVCTHTDRCSNMPVSQIVCLHTNRCSSMPVSQVVCRHTDRCSSMPVSQVLCLHTDRCSSMAISQVVQYAYTLGRLKTDQVKSRLLPLLSSLAASGTLHNFPW